MPTPHFHRVNTDCSACSSSKLSSLLKKSVPASFKEPITSSKNGSFFNVGKTGEFKSIQMAIDEAHLQGGGTIYLEPGHYHEDLIFYPGITLEGCGIADLRFVCIYGKHLLPEFGELGFNHILFSNESSIFTGVAPKGHPNLLFRSCVFEVNFGYFLDIPDLGGTVIFFDCFSTGENNGFINNCRGSCEPTLFNMTIDGGKRINSMYVNSRALLFNLHVKVKMEFSGENSLTTINGGCWLEDTFYIKNGAAVKIAGSNIETQDKVSFTVDKGAFLSLDNCSIESSAKEIGQGFGTIRLGMVSFSLQSKLAETLEVLQAAEFFKITQKVGCPGNADVLPSAPLGYLVTNINGSECLIPYYSKP